MVVADTSAVLAYYDRGQSSHQVVGDFLQVREEPLLMSPLVLAELDYMIAKRVGQGMRLKFLSEVAEGAFSIQTFGSDDLDFALGIIEKYRDLRVSLADASVVVLAHRHHTDKVFTLDQRHFRAMEGPDREPFKLLPLDG